MNSGNTLIFHSCRREQFLPIIQREKEKHPDYTVTPLLLPGMEFDPETDPSLAEPIYLPDGMNNYRSSGVDAKFYNLIKTRGFNQVILPFNNPSGVGYLSAVKLAYKLNIKKIIAVNPDLNEALLPSILSFYILKSIFVRMFFYLLSLLTLIVTPLLTGLAVIALRRGRRNLVRPQPSKVNLQPLGTDFTVSVIIPTMGDVNKLSDLFDGLARQSRPPDEVLVVLSDNAELDPLNSLLGRYNWNPKIIRSPLGVTIQKNRGIEAAAGDILIFLDDDLIPAKEFISELARVFEKDGTGQLAGATGFITNKTDHDRLLVTLIEKMFFLPKRGNGRFRRSGFPTWPDESTGEIPVEFLPGGLTAFRREVVEAFGFDETLPGYGYLDDSDLSFRTSRHFRHIFVPTARCLHFTSPRGRRTRRFRAAMLVRHHTRLAAGNLPAGPVSALAFGLSICGLLLRSLAYLDLDYVRGIGAGLIDTLIVRST